MLTIDQSDTSPSDVASGIAVIPDEIVDNTKKKNFKRFCKKLNGHFKLFARTTTLECFKYIADNKTVIVEKLFWAVVLIVSVYLGSVMIWDTYVKWQHSPVIVSFAKSPTPIGNIPFPAITICPETKAKQTLFNFTRFYYDVKRGDQNVTEEGLLVQNLIKNVATCSFCGNLYCTKIRRMHRFEDISLLCDHRVHKTGRLTTDTDVVEYYREVAPTFDDTLRECIWQSQLEACEDIFNPMLSEEGICYTFNMLDRDEIYTKEVFHNENLNKADSDSKGWSLESGYDKNEGLGTFPKRAMTAGIKAGLTVEVMSFIDDQDITCRGPVQGFKVSLHNPGEIPMVASNFFRAPLNREIVIAIQPDMITTSTGLKGYEPHKRGCYFAQERPLRYFKEYTQGNCNIECQTNITYDMCGCVSFHMPHAENTPICGSGSNECVTNAQLKMVSEASTSCDCLPACTTLTYDSEMSQANFDWKSMLEAFQEDTSQFSGVQMTRLRFLFKGTEFITSERNELYGMVDFVGNCGGLLGLFIGLSFMSVIEVGYFLLMVVGETIKYVWLGCVILSKVPQKRKNGERGIFGCGKID